MIAEYNNATTLLRRYVHGSNAEADDPLVWYEGTSVASSNARHLHADPRGSIVLVAGASGNTLAINTYDEYGIPDSASGNDIATKGRFRYTGQAWLPELDMYHYKARVYSPTLGRFLQTDPIGYEDQFNLYAYVGNDPVNGVDPTGTSCTISGGATRLPSASCRLDDRKSFEKAGWSKADIRKAERSYSRAVTSLLRSNKTVTVTVDDRSFRADARTVARGLSAAYARYGGESGRRNASMAGGALSPLSKGQGPLRRGATVNPDGRPFTLSLFSGFKGKTESEQREILAHEGIHTHPGERVMIGLPRGRHYHFHGPNYRKAAAELLDE